MQKADIALTLPDEQGPTSKIFKPSAGAMSTAGGERAIAQELADEGDEVLKQLKEQQREVIDSLDLKQ